MLIPFTARAGAVCLIALGIAGAQTVTVGPNVQVSKDLAGDAHFEMQIAADPFDAGRLLACSMLFPSDFASSREWYTEHQNSVSA